MTQPAARATADRPPPGRCSGAHPDEDQVLAAILVRMWALASGRTLRSGVPPDQLSAEELIDFWADDMTSRSGRHARSDGSDRAPGAQYPGKTARQAPQARRGTRRPSPRVLL